MTKPNANTTSRESTLGELSIEVDVEEVGSCRESARDEIVEIDDASVESIDESRATTVQSTVSSSATPTQVDDAARFEQMAVPLRRLGRLEAERDVQLIRERAVRELELQKKRQAQALASAERRAELGVKLTRWLAGSSIALVVGVMGFVGQSLQPKLVDGVSAEIPRTFALADYFFWSDASAELNPGSDESEAQAVASATPKPRRTPRATTSTSSITVTDALGTSCSGDPYDPLNGCLM